MDLLWDGIREAFGMIIQADRELMRLAAFSLAVSLTATMLATLVGVPVGIALAIGRFPARRTLQVIVSTGMGLPPVLVGLTLSLLLWRTGPFGPLQLIYTPTALILAQFIVAAPVAAGITRAAIELLEPDLRAALQADGAGTFVTSRELVLAALPQVLLAITAAFGRAIAEVGASLMVGGNIAGYTRTLTTAITLETGRGNFALAIALGIILLALALLVNAAVHWHAEPVAT